MNNKNIVINKFDSNWSTKFYYTGVQPFFPDPAPCFKEKEESASTLSTFFYQCSKWHKENDAQHSQLPKQRTKCSAHSSNDAQMTQRKRRSKQCEKNYEQHTTEPQEAKRRKKWCKENDAQTITRHLQTPKTLIHKSEDKRLVTISKWKWTLCKNGSCQRFSIKTTTTTMTVTLMQATLMATGMPPVRLRPAEQRVAQEPPISTSGSNKTRFRNSLAPKASKRFGRRFHQMIGGLSDDESMDRCSNLLPCCQCTPQSSSWIAILSGGLGWWGTWPPLWSDFQDVFKQEYAVQTNERLNLEWLANLGMKPLEATNELLMRITCTTRVIKESFTEYGGITPDQ
jgi:hypothetical protein